MTVMLESRQVEVCGFDEVQPERGVRALVWGRHVAVFRTWEGDVYALDAVDPFCGASVLSRGIVGTSGADVFVASPMYKQRFDLRTGRCLDDQGVSVSTYPVDVVDGRIVIDGA